MRVLAFVVLWRNVLTSKQTASCRALSKVITVSFPLFSSLLFPLFSSLLFVKKQFPPFLCCCWLLLNPDSRAQRENQDLLFWIFFHHEWTISSFFFAKNETRPKTSNHHRPLLFIDSSYINAPNTHTYKMALSMQSALAGKQITVNKVSSKRYVYLIFAWWSYALNYDCPFFCFMQYALFFFGRDWEGKSMMASSSRCLYTHTHLSCLNALRHHQNNTTVRSTRRSSKRPTCRKSSPRRPSLRPPPPRCSHRYVSFFFALLVSF